VADWEKKMEQEWGRAFVHESGHALMAVLKKIPCHGIFYEKQSGKFCALTDMPSSTELSQEHYLFLTASSAAELLIYGNVDDDGAKSDRSFFANPGAPPLTETAQEAMAIVSNKKRQLKRLVSSLKAKCRRVDYNLLALPEKRMDGTNLIYAILLSREELESAVNRA
jgi:hypothetical protein